MNYRKQDKKSCELALQAMRVWTHSLFSQGQWPLENACWGASPNPADFGTFCPKVLFVCGTGLSLLFLIFAATRGPDEVIDIPLDGDDLPHFPLGSAILHAERFPPLHKLGA